MSAPIPATPFFANAAFWQQAANNLLDRGEALLRDEIAWRRARPCLMAEYFRVAMLEGSAFLRPHRRGRYNHWRWRCQAEHAAGPQLCPFSEEK